MALDSASPLSTSTPKRMKDDELRATKLQAGKKRFLAFQKKREMSSRQSSMLPAFSNSSSPLPFRHSEHSFHKELVSLKSEITTLRLHYEDELQKLRNKIDLLCSSSSPPSPVTISEPVPRDPAPQQPTPQPQQPTSRPVSDPTPQPAPVPVPKSKKRKKKKRKRKNCSHKDRVYEVIPDIVGKCLAQAILRLNANFGDDFKKYPDNFQRSRFSPVSDLRTYPNPSRIKYSPGLHPGIIPLMNIVFV